MIDARSIAARKPGTFAPLPEDRLRPLQGWAMVRRAAGYVWQPQTVDEVRDVLELARTRGRTVAPRGSGYSYGDAALNAEEIVLDLSQMRRIVQWDAATGLIRVEPGVTVRDLWRAVLPDGWWPKVVPGTMGPSIGGCLAMNVHGKNAWNAGPIGAQVLRFDLLTSTGDLLTVTREHHPEIFRAAIGGLGMLGVITSATLHMRKVQSGQVSAHQRRARNLDEMFAIFAQEEPTADYLVGWIDGFAGGNALGRGLVERADFLEADDPASLRPEAQDLPPKIAGIVPRSELWRAMKPIFNDLLMRPANGAQYRLGSGARPYMKPLAQFHFFHDYLPNWQRAWLPGGLRQFQVFVPARHASTIFAELLRRAQRAGLPPYLAVFKQHRANDFLLAYEVDGFSLSLDFHVTARNADRLAVLLRTLIPVVLAGDGRFYLAKDDVLTAAEYARSVGQEHIDAFLALKRRLDPEGVWSSNLFRRVFAG